MRRIASILIGFFLCESAWATVTIALTKISDTKVAIGYNATTELQLVRAFALDVTVTGGTIVGIADYAVGDDNNGYGIFPANFNRYITVNPTTGEVESWDDPNYTPVAPPDTPGALGGLGTNGITIEMGSLYDTNPPPKSGVLCTITVHPCATKLCVNGNVIRGNIVMEDGSERVPVEACIFDLCPLDCFPNTARYAIQYADWVMYGKPKCWCNAASISIPPEDISCTTTMNYTAGDYQCDGDASGKPYLTTGWRVYTDDLNIIAANWKRKISGTPPANPCADISHKGYLTIGWRVYTDDLGILAANWKKKAGTPPAGLAGNCPRPE